MASQQARDGAKPSAQLRQRTHSWRSQPDRDGSLDAGRRTSPGLRTPDAPQPVDLKALVRERYYAHICTQMLASNASAMVFVLGMAIAPSDSHWDRLFGLLLLSLVCAHGAASLAFPLRRVLPARLRACDDATAVGRALLLDSAINLFFTPIIFAAFMWRENLRAANCPAAAGLGGCGLAYIGTMNLSRSFRPVVSQVPPRLAFQHEVARAALTALCALAAYALDGDLGLHAAAAVLLYSAGALAFTLALVSLHHDAMFADADYLPQWLDLWPECLRPAREAVLQRLSALATRVAPMPLHYNVMCGLNLLGNTLAGVLHARETPLATFGPDGRIVLHVYFTLSITAAVSAKLSGGGAATLGELARKLGLDSDRSLVDEVRNAVADASSEAEALHGAAAALRRRLFPEARALSLRISLSGDETPLSVALGAAPPAGDDVIGGEEEENSSRAFVAAQDRALVADSRDFPSGLTTFVDWARAGAAGADVVVTASLPAGPALLGTLVASFANAAPIRYEQVLLRCCRVIGEGMFARRESATSSAVSALTSDVFPERVMASLLQRSRRASMDGSLARSFSRRRSSVASMSELDAPAEDAAPSPDAGSPPAVPELHDGDVGGATTPRDPAAAMRQRRLSARQSSPGAPSDDGSDLFYSEQHECVSVVFVDLVDFTPLAESQDSLATMQMLHALFCRFDDLCDELGVFKVETVGDMFVAVAGLLSPAAAGSARRHAAAAALFALRTHAAAAACGLRVRAGVHSGPVTSGLVGRLRPRYCLFGDTVNTTSRLEAAGVPGCVQLSRSSWRLAGLPDALSPQERRLQLKGKAGALDACLLHAAAPEAAQAEAVLKAQLELYDDAEPTKDGQPGGDEDFPAERL